MCDANAVPLVRLNRQIDFPENVLSSSQILIIKYTQNPISAGVHDAPHPAGGTHGALQLSTACRLKSGMTLAVDTCVSISTHTQRFAAFGFSILSRDTFCSVPAPLAYAKIKLIRPNKTKNSLGTLSSSSTDSLYS